jgi:hypothetical protein
MGSIVATRNGCHFITPPKLGPRTGQTNSVTGACSIGGLMCPKLSIRLVLAAGDDDVPVPL